MIAEAWDTGTRRAPGRISSAGRSPIPKLARAERVTMVVQMNGKPRDRIEVDADIDDDEAARLALASPRVIEALAGVAPARVMVRPPRLVNLVH